jgi:hypothetical protein
MLKHYIYKGKEWIYEEGEQPEGAVELKKKTPPANKAVKPANKAVKPATKTRRAAKK